MTTPGHASECEGVKGHTRLRLREVKDRGLGDWGSRIGNSEFRIVYEVPLSELVLHQSVGRRGWVTTVGPNDALQTKTI